MKGVALALLALTLLLAFACSSSDKQSGVPATELSGCLERPEQLPRAPDGHLPCDLIPPGLSLR